MGGVVGEIETDFETEFFPFRVIEPSQAGTQQALNFCVCRRLGLQLAYAH